MDKQVIRQVSTYSVVTHPQADAWLDVIENAASIEMTCYETDYTADECQKNTYLTYTTAQRENIDKADREANQVFYKKSKEGKRSGLNKRGLCDTKAPLGCLNRNGRMDRSKPRAVKKDHMTC